MAAMRSEPRRLAGMRVIASIATKTHHCETIGVAPFLTTPHTENLQAPCSNRPRRLRMGKAVMRSLSLLAFGCLVGLFAYTYSLKLKTRALEAEAQQLANALQDESDFLALMRAEVSYVSRPDWIEGMAKKTLKLEPIAPAQLIPWSAVTGAQLSAAASSTVQVVRKDGIAALIEKASVQAEIVGRR